MTSSDPTSAPPDARSPWESAARAFAEVLLPLEAARTAADLAVMSAQWAGVGDQREAVLDAVRTAVAQRLYGAISESGMRAAEQAFATQPADETVPHGNGPTHGDGPTDRVAVALPAESNGSPRTQRASVVDVPADWLDALPGPVPNGAQTPVADEPPVEKAPVADVKAPTPEKDISTAWRDALARTQLPPSGDPPVELDLPTAEPDLLSASTGALPTEAEKAVTPAYAEPPEDRDPEDWELDEWESSAPEPVGAPRRSTPQPIETPYEDANRGVFVAAPFVDGPALRFRLRRRLVLAAAGAVAAGVIGVVGVVALDSSSPDADAPATRAVTVPPASARLTPAPPRAGKTDRDASESRRARERRRAVARQRTRRNAGVAESAPAAPQTETTTQTESALPAPVQNPASTPTLTQRPVVPAPTTPESTPEPEPAQTTPSDEPRPSEPSTEPRRQPPAG